MKKLIIPAGIALASVLLFSGCVAAIGNRDAKHNSSATIGQQLIDLQKAKEAGALTDAEYAAEKSKLLESK